GIFRPLQVLVLFFLVPPGRFFLGTERERGRGWVNTNTPIGSLARERTSSISNKIESLIKLRKTGEHELGPDGLLLLALL
ncbi:unnamed protein product, partial [Prunus brigantina]